MVHPTGRRQCECVGTHTIFNATVTNITSNDCIFLLILKHFTKILLYLTSHQ